MPSFRPIAINSLLLAVMFATATQASPAPTPGNDLYKAITQVPTWLNTSRALTPDDLKHRIILLDFWTFCCINCMHIIPDLQKLEQEFGQDLTVIGVHSAKFANEKDTSSIRSAILRYGIEHPVVNDSDFKIWKALGVNSWPTLILLSSTGEIAHVYEGEGHFDDLKKNIAQLRSAGDLNRRALPIALEKSIETPLRFPSKLAYAADRKLLFVTDSGHDRIVAIHPDTGKVAFTIGQNGKKGNRGGKFHEALFNQPQGILYKDDTLYIADTLNHVLKKADLRKKIVTTIAGTGLQGFDRDVESYPALETAMSSPWDLAFFPNDQTITIAMAGTHQLWMYGINNKKVTVLAGNGREAIDDGDYPANSLAQPSGLSVFQGKLYFVDSETSSLRVLENGLVRTLVGTGLFDFGFKDGRKGSAQLQHPLALYADENGVTITDSYNHSLRRYDLKTGVLSTLIGDGAKGILNEPAGITKIGANYVIADTNDHTLKVWTPGTKNFTTLEVAETKQTPQKEEQRKLADFLPQLQKTEPVSLAPTTIDLNFVLEPGWHLNEAAPSWLALFDISGAKPKLVREFSQAEVVKTQIVLPKLNQTGKYRLQGTLYFCSIDKGSVCLIQSTDQTINVALGGAPSIDLQLKRKR